MIKAELLSPSGIKVYQDDEGYCFTSDALLLSRFATVKKGDNIADFCSGSGVIAFNIYDQYKDLIKSATLFEMQQPLYDLSLLSIKENGLEEKFTAINVKVQDIDACFNERFSLITCNPPYMKADGGENKFNPQIAICRAELYLELEELIKAVSKCLKFGGRFAMVHRAERLTDTFALMRKFNIEPKRLQLVQAKGKAPYLFMVEGVKGGKSGLKVLPNLDN
ncbi:MAG: methyltransferase [Clostridia bacterium]|nr:methyltransferase [Clostridia bacterium]